MVCLKYILAYIFLSVVVCACLIWVTIHGFGLFWDIYTHTHKHSKQEWDRQTCEGYHGWLQAVFGLVVYAGVCKHGLIFEWRIWAIVTGFCCIICPLIELCLPNYHSLLDYVYFDYWVLMSWYFFFLYEY